MYVCRKPGGRPREKAISAFTGKSSKSCSEKCTILYKAGRSRDMRIHINYYIPWQNLRQEFFERLL